MKLASHCCPPVAPPVSATAGLTSLVDVPVKLLEIDVHDEIAAATDRFA